MRILFASRAFLWLAARVRTAPRVFPHRPPYAHRCAIERVRGVIIHTKERSGTASAFVAPMFGTRNSLPWR